MRIANADSSRLLVALAATMALAASTASATFLSNSFSRRAECGVYTIITTRGTGEQQGPSIAFTTMIRDTLSAVDGGDTYDAVYAAGQLQQSDPATVDVINRMKTTLEQCPNHKFALLGYSQGATATTEVLTRTVGDDAIFNAVSAVVLVGNPRHGKDLLSNYDTNGGKSTANGTGLLSALPPIPPRWDQSRKCLDICAFNDGICDREDGVPFGPEHGTYATSDWTQSRSADLMTDAFKAAAAAPSSTASTSSSSTASVPSSVSTSSSSTTQTQTSVVSPSGTGRPQADAAMSLSGSSHAVLVTAAALGFGALLVVM